MEVNKPLRIEKMKVYQSSYTARAVVEVETPSGSIITVSQDHHVVTDSGVFFFTGLGPPSDNDDAWNAQTSAENDGEDHRGPMSTDRQSEAVSAIFTQYRDQKLISRYRLNPGDPFEGHTIKAIHLQSGILFLPRGPSSSERYGLKRRGVHSGVGTRRRHGHLSPGWCIPRFSMSASSEK